MEIKNIDKAPGALGPYSHAVIHSDLIFCSGQVALDPETMKLVGDDIEAQTLQVMKNIETVLKGLGSSLQNIIKTTIFIDNMEDFPKLNKVYGDFLQGHKPARSTVEVAKLPLNALVEIECIAAKTP